MPMNPVTTRTPDDYKRYLRQLLEDLENKLGQVVAVKGDMDAFSDAELAAAMGLKATAATADSAADTQANNIHGAYNAAATMAAAWSKSAQNLALGIRFR